MSMIYLIRHGQASFGQADYDALSALGSQQAQILGKHLAALGIPVAAVYCGLQRRQRDTAEAMLAGAGWAGTTLPGIKACAGFNEYDFEAVLAAQFPLMVSENPSLRQDLDRIYEDSGAFRRVFQGAMLRWVSGDHECPGVESWKAFRERTVAALEQVSEPMEKGRTILVCTSGGPIAAILSHLLNLSAETALRLNWQIVNASYTRVVDHRGGWTLAGFNSVAHLESMRDPRWITYR